MARLLVELAGLAWGQVQTRAGHARAGLALKLVTVDGAPVTVYADRDGLVPLAGAPVTDADGLWPGFVEVGEYKLTEPDGDVRFVQAISGVAQADQSGSSWVEGPGFRVGIPEDYANPAVTGGGGNGPDDVIIGLIPEPGSPAGGNWVGRPGAMNFRRAAFRGETMSMLRVVENNDPSELRLTRVQGVNTGWPTGAASNIFRKGPVGGFTELAADVVAGATELWLPRVDFFPNRWGTKTNGAHVLPTGTITVDSTEGFPSSGQIVVGTQTVTYTGKTATTFTGCTNGAGAVASGALVRVPNVDFKVGGIVGGQPIIYTAKSSPGRNLCGDHALGAASLLVDDASDMPAAGKFWARGIETVSYTAKAQFFAATVNGRHQAGSTTLVVNVPTTGSMAALPAAGSIFVQAGGNRLLLTYTSKNDATRTFTLSVPLTQAVTDLSAVAVWQLTGVTSTFAVPVDGDHPAGSTLLRLDLTGPRGGWMSAGTAAAMWADLPAAGTLRVEVTLDPTGPGTRDHPTILISYTAKSADGILTLAAPLPYAVESPAGDEKYAFVNGYPGLSRAETNGRDVQVTKLTGVAGLTADVSRGAPVEFDPRYRSPGPPAALGFLAGSHWTTNGHGGGQNVLLMARSIEDGWTEKNRGGFWSMTLSHPVNGARVQSMIWHPNGIAVLGREVTGDGSLAGAPFDVSGPICHSVPLGLEADDPDAEPDPDNPPPDPSGEGAIGTFHVDTTFQFPAAGRLVGGVQNLVTDLNEQREFDYAALGADKSSFTGVTFDNTSQGPSTTLTGAHVLPTGTINVASTAGFAAKGKLKIGADTVTYTGKTGTSFTGCTGGVGSPGDGTVVREGFVLADFYIPSGTAFGVADRTPYETIVSRRRVVAGKGKTGETIIGGVGPTVAAPEPGVSMGTLALFKRSDGTPAAAIAGADVGGLAMWSSGTHAARPAAGVANRMYFETDTHVLYRDTGSVWQAMSPGYVSKTADEIVNNSAVLQNDDHLLFPVEANEQWMIELFLKLNAPSGVPDWKFGWSLPAAASLRWGVVGDPAAITGAWFGVGTAGTPSLSRDQTQSVSMGSVSGRHGATVLAMLTVGANAGAAQFQWAQDTATIANSILEGLSTMRITRVT